MEASAVARPRVWTVALVYVLAVGGMLCSGAIVGLAAGLSVVFAEIGANGGAPLAGGILTEERLHAIVAQPPLFTGMLLVAEACLLVVALPAARLSPVPVVSRLALGPSAGTGARRAFAVVVGTLGALAVSDGTSQVMFLLGWTSTSLERFGAQMRDLPAAWLPAALLGLAVAAPVAEEILFRGYMQTRLVARFGRVVGVGVTAVAFGLMHIDPLHAAHAAVIGVYLGWLREHTGSVRPAIVAHAVNNAVATLAARYVVAEGSTLLAVVTLAICVVVTAGSVVGVRRWGPGGR